MNNKVIVRKPNSFKTMSRTELADWANAVNKMAGGRAVFSRFDFPERLKGYHCDCGITDEGYTKGIFVLYPLSDEGVRSGGKAYMTCCKCGGCSHL